MAATGNDMKDLDNMSFAELKEHAELIGVQFAANILENTLRNKIKTHLGEAAEATKEPVNVNKKDKEKRVKIIISESDTDLLPVHVSVNGRRFSIPRGIEVEVPPSVIEVLTNAKTVTYDPRTMAARKVMRFPFQVVS